MVRGKGEGPVPYRSATQMASANGFRNARPKFGLAVCAAVATVSVFSPQFWIAL
jgi:hypothetical protein